MLPYLIAGAIGFGIGKLFENGGETFMAGGRITTNEGIIESFLNSNREVRVGNLESVEMDDIMYLRNYRTFIAKRMGDKVKISSQKYSQTTSKITNRLKALAEKMGYSVEYVTEKEIYNFDEFEEGGETFMEGGRITKYVQLYFVQGNYGQGFEDLTAHDNRKDAIAEMRVYDDNESYPHRVIQRRVLRTDYEKGNYAEGGGVEYRIGGEVDKELTIEQTRKIAQETANILGTEFSVTKNSVDVASFDLDLNGEEFEGGSYLIMKNGDVLNVALPNNPVYYNYKERSKNPKMIRTIFEEEYFENFDNGGESDDKLISIARAIFNPNEDNGKIATSFGKKTFDGFVEMIKQNDAYDIYYNIWQENAEGKYIATTYGDKTYIGLLEMLKSAKNEDDYREGGLAKKRRRSASIQYGRSNTAVDKTRVAKPVGYRFTNAKASELRKDPYAKPTEAQIKKYLGKGIYKENRKRHSDKDRNAKL